MEGPVSTVPLPACGMGWRGRTEDLHQFPRVGVWAACLPSFCALCGACSFHLAFISESHARKCGEGQGARALEFDGALGVPPKTASLCPRRSTGEALLIGGESGGGDGPFLPRTRPFAERPLGRGGLAGGPRRSSLTHSWAGFVGAEQGHACPTAGGAIRHRKRPTPRTQRQNRRATPCRIPQSWPGAEAWASPKGVSLGQCRVKKKQEWGHGLRTPRALGSAPHAGLRGGARGAAYAAATGPLSGSRGGGGGTGNGRTEIYTCPLPLRLRGVSLPHGATGAGGGRRLGGGAGHNLIGGPRRRGPVGRAAEASACPGLPQNTAPEANGWGARAEPRGRATPLVVWGTAGRVVCLWRNRTESCRRNSVLLSQWSPPERYTTHTSSYRAHKAWLAIPTRHN